MYELFSEYNIFLFLSIFKTYNTSLYNKIIWGIFDASLLSFNKYAINKFRVLW